jgi:hypothetical protein
MDLPASTGQTSDRQDRCRRKLKYLSFAMIGDRKIVQELLTIIEPQGRTYGFDH